MFEGMSGREKRKVKILFLYIGVTSIVYLFFRYILYLLAPFLIALFVAWILNRPVSWLKKKFHLPRILGSILVLLLLFGGIGTGLWYLGGLAIHEFRILIGNYGYYMDCLNRETLHLCDCVDRGFGLMTGSTYEFVDVRMQTIVENGCDAIIQKILGGSVGFTKECAMWLAAGFIALTASLFLINDFEKVQKAYYHGSISEGLQICFGKMFRFGLVFLRTQMLIMMITTLVCTWGLLFLHNAYALLIGVGVGILDALPILGTGTVLIPWTVISLIRGKYFEAAVVFSIYLICYSIREFLEPKLMGNHMGIHPVLMLLTMYVGVILFGVIGFILGPAAYIMITEIVDYLKKVL